MELGLSLGEASKPFPLVEKVAAASRMNTSQGLGFCMGLGVVGVNGREGNTEGDEREGNRDGEREERRVSADPSPVQLDLLPSGPVPRNPPLSTELVVFSWPTENGNSEAGSSGHLGVPPARGFDVNRLPSAEEADDGAQVSSPNSTVSSFQMDFSMFRGGSSSSKRDNTELNALASMNDADTPERTSSRASDEEENGLTRKKLRLSKEQSAFLEESFKEHNTLNPKQKLALAKQLNLRPRQVEVWFQNRRARTKLKQTEVDCEYLKRYCETLTEENRRLQKELQELRALKTSHPFYMQLPATTLTMCPSCERVATASTTLHSSAAASAITTTASTTKTNSTATATATTTTTTTDGTATPTPLTPTPKTTTALSLTKPRFYPFSHAHAHPSPAS
ncbi:homeobox-leucine zipper protein HOX11-like isoform X2 [Macadamia integrifolia]|uniref:homeobox-leucine zipper protein HOX11-like isoform X2 n=1 Tax=Macadamia integrifolia TaxID=60698 RepID=UPI001C4E9D0F|nr:homeobox-leucine zipper protein HOX11-like isoform X2 [Macadamia integrifolia]